MLLWEICILIVYMEKWSDVLKTYKFWNSFSENAQFILKYISMMPLIFAVEFSK